MELPPLLAVHPWLRTTSVSAVLSFHSELTATLRAAAASGRPLANKIKISICTLVTLRLKLEGLGNIRGTFLTCAPFLYHAYATCFLTALIVRLPQAWESPVAVSIHTSYASRVHRAPSDAIGRGEEDLKPGRAATDSSL